MFEILESLEVSSKTGWRG